LELLPRGQEKALKQVLPAHGRLGGSGAVNFFFVEVEEGEGIVTLPVEAGEQGLLNAGMGVGFLKVGSELCNAFIPDITGAFGSAPKHMGGFFRDTTLRACVIVLVFLFDEGLAIVGPFLSGYCQ